MSFTNEGKLLFAYDYVSLKTDERNRKNIKKRCLGDMKNRCGSRKAHPSLVGSLMNLYFPETRAINRTTADGIIADQRDQIRQTLNKNQREAILDEWARPSEDKNCRPSLGSKEVTELRPKTAPGYHGLNHVPFEPGPTPRLYTAGSFRVPPRKPPQPSGFMWVKMKQKGSEVKGLRTITDEVQDYWREEDKKERERRNRAKKQEDSFSGGWLSFAGSEEADCVSLVDAFAGDNTDQYYNVDGKVGSVVARHLQRGSQLRIGQNGNLQSETLRIRSAKESSELEKLRDDPVKPVPPSLVPLDWTEQMSRPDVKVMGTSKTVTPAPAKITCERRPVVYSKLIPTNERPKIHIKLDKYCIRHRSKPKLNVDGTESLSQRITTITVDDLTNEDADAMSTEEYNTLLRERLERDLTAHPEPVRRTSLKAVDVDAEKSISLASLDQMSEVSNLTFDKPPSLRCIQRTNSQKQTIPPASSRATLVPNQRSVADMSVRSSSPKSWTSNPVLRPRSEMGRRREPSAVSRRAKSGTSRRYVFDRPVTPRSLHSPRPKPGQMFRSGVSSINSGPLEGEQEYIQISYQYPPRHLHTSSDAEPSVVGSLSSQQRGDSHQDCGCTEDAKKVVSAVFGVHSPFIDIPHGSGHPGATPQVSFKTSSDSIQDDEEESDQYSEKDNLSDLEDFLDSTPPDGGNTEFENTDTQEAVLADVEQVLDSLEQNPDEEEQGKGFGQLCLDNWEESEPHSAPVDDTWNDDESQEASLADKKHGLDNFEENPAEEEQGKGFGEL